MCARARRTRSCVYAVCYVQAARRRIRFGTLRWWTSQPETTTGSCANPCRVPPDGGTSLSSGTEFRQLSLRPAPLNVTVTRARQHERWISAASPAPHPHIPSLLLPPSTSKYYILHLQQRNRIQVGTKSHSRMRSLTHIRFAGVDTRIESRRYARTSSTCPKQRRVRIAFCSDPKLNDKCSGTIFKFP